MDFEWEKLINGESEIDADDINALADGIIGNEKEIKAIKDIMDNGGTIPEYLTDFFKEIPEGKTIDDLSGDDCAGCYILYEPEYLGNIGLLYVGFGTYIDGEMANLCTWQTRYMQDGHGTVKIETRNDADGYWSGWEDVFATPQYVKEQIAKIPTGGGELETLATVNIEEEINDITISADSQGNPFELKELFAYIQIPAVTDGIQPIIYIGSENNCNRTLDNLTTDSYIVIRWRREEGIAEFQVYNYGTRKFKNLTILNVADTNIVNKLRIYHKTQAYPIGTSITLKGKRV